VKQKLSGLRLRHETQGTGPEDAPFALSVDGEEITAYPGDTIAAALYAAGRRAWRTARNGEPRGLLCGIGVCFDCLVTVDGVPNIRACQALAQPGMVVVTGQRGEDVE
jgi:predicted molibdopterin-dependent oxidoreductase YjgC